MKEDNSLPLTAVERLQCKMFPIKRIEKEFIIAIFFRNFKKSL